MKTGILIEELKERMAGQKVRAALFYTFNFDARFFENYILTQFLPDVSFSNNEIQNAILWKKYQNELPPITVFCDFHAKGTTGPSLAYTIVPIDMPTNESGGKPCFHPKLSYVLLEDWSLIVLGGSNNITQSGWCSNIEGVNVFHFTPYAEEGYYPRTLKDSFKNLRRNVRRDILEKEDITESEEVIESFFGSIKYSDEENIHFFNSSEKTRKQNNEEGLRSFEFFINKLKQDYNLGKSFVKAEVISPYYSTGIKHFNIFSKVIGTNQIKFSVPFENTDYVAMDENIYKEIEELYGWGTCSFDNGKAFRFNHSKIYRLLGRDKMITIVGSVNCTDAAFRGVADGGNYETAVAYIDDASKWVDQLKEVCNNSFTFTQAKEEEGYEDDRIDAFDLEFTLDWRKSELTVSNRCPAKQKGRIIFENLPNKELSNKMKTTIKLTQKMVEIFTDNSLIKFKPKGIDSYMYYYPTQKGIELKPLSSKYNLSDIELLELWQELDGVNDKESTGRVIEHFVDRITDEFDEEKDDEELNTTKSSINIMASHLSGLLKLKEKLFMDYEKKSGKDLEIQKKRISYYLLSDNIDTLIGYRKLITKMKDNGSIKIGFYWVLLKVIESYFYKNKAFKKKINKEDHKALETLVSLITKQVKAADKKMLEQGVERAKLNWLSKTLLDDFK